MTGAVSLVGAGIDTYLARAAADAISRHRGPGPIFDLGPFPGLREQLPGCTVIDPTTFDADILALPFPDRALGAVVGIHLLDQLDGKALPQVIRECARVAECVSFVLGRDLLLGPISRSTQQIDGRYVTEFGTGWWTNCVVTWPEPWCVAIERFRTIPGAVITLWCMSDQWNTLKAQEAGR